MSADPVTDHVQAARSWVRIAAACAVLTGLAFVQSPGYLIADTKFDLVENPVGYLGRALHIWDPDGAFGQLQNQAYGYLWPMGPFFVLGELSQLPGWVVQRLWLAVVMCVAFAGAVRVVRALGVRSELAALLAGFAYATSPRMLTTLGPISIEAWPSAVAPWVLLPLVIGSSRGSPRRMAALAGLAVAMVGGVNAAATAAVLPLGAIWLLTREPGPRRRSLMLWWPVFTAVGTLWWLVPLFLLGAYSPPFLDYIETSTVTTFPTALFDVLRGTSAWTPYIDGGLRAGNDLITLGYPALNSGLLLMLGLVGMVVRGNPHRRFLALSALTGLVLVSLGHQGAVQGWFAVPLGEALDGALSAIRNVHKFDPIVRLPLVVGLAWAVQAVVEGAPGRLRIRRRELRVPAGAGVVGLAIVGVIGAAAPLVTGQLAPARPVVRTPDYWQATAAWLDEHSEGTVSLLAPASGFAQYLWGSPDDEPLQFLADSRWAVRNAIPLAPPGNIRMLDAIEDRLLQGQPSAGLAAYLRRAGVGHVVVRNDLAPADDRAHPALVHQALDGSPGLERVATFGPLVGGDPVLVRDRRVVIESGWQTRHRAVEIFAVAGTESAATSTTDAPAVVGGPEDLLDLADRGVVTDAPAVLAVDAPAELAPRTVVQTDGLVLRERFFGRVHDSAGAATTPGDVRRTTNRQRDYAPDGPSTSTRWRTTTRLLGASAVSASSSAADAGALGGSRRGESAYAAVDGLLATSWTSDPGSTRVPWWRVDLDRPRPVERVTVVVGDDAPDRVLLRVRTDAGVSDLLETAPGRSRTVAVPPGDTRSIVVESAAPGPHRLSLREVYWKGSDVRRQRVLPALPETWGTADHVLVRADRDHRTGCAEIVDRAPCRADQVGSSEESHRFERIIPSNGQRSYDVELTAVPRPGPDLEVALQERKVATVFASSSAVPDPRGSGMAAFDDDPGTSWVADPDDTRPVLALSWTEPRAVGRLTLAVSPEAPVRRPTKVLLTWPGGSRVAYLDRLGRTSFPPVRTDRMNIEVTAAEDAVTLDTQDRVRTLPIGVSELRVGRVGFGVAKPDPRVRRWSCGTGPTVTIAGEPVRTRVVASAQALFRMREVPVEPCGPGASERVRLRAGDNLLVAEAGTLARPGSVLLTTGRVSPDVAAVDLDAQDPQPTTQVAPSHDLLVMHQNHNPGWTARQGGTTLAPVVVDGWQQGWWLADGGAPVQVSFGPGTVYRAAVLGGLALLAGLAAALLLLPRRRWPGTDQPPCARERIAVPVAVGAPLLAAGLLAGWAGAAIAVGSLVLVLVLRGRVGPGVAEPTGWAAAALVAAAATAYQVRPWGSPDGWAGAMAWVSYLTLGSVLVVAFLAARPRFAVASRMKGRSTRR